MLLEVELSRSKPGSSWLTLQVLPVQWEMVEGCCEHMSGPEMGRLEQCDRKNVAVLS